MPSFHTWMEGYCNEGYCNPVTSDCTNLFFYFYLFSSYIRV